MIVVRAIVEGPPACASECISACALHRLRCLYFLSRANSWRSIGRFQAAGGYICRFLYRWRRQYFVPGLWIRGGVQPAGWALVDGRHAAEVQQARAAIAPRAHARQTRTRSASKHTTFPASKHTTFRRNFDTMLTRSIPEVLSSMALSRFLPRSTHTETRLRTRTCSSRT
jgi:hypothetical protein